jgi:transposase
MWAGRSKTFNRRQLTTGLDLGNRFSCYCVLDEVGEVILEQKLPTTPEAIRRAFEKMPRSRMALETGTHSRWVSRLLTVLGHEVIVAHARNVRLIGESRRKDDRLDARMLASGTVARKLAVLLHRLWVSGEVYEPLRNRQKAVRAVA